ncbi:MAG: hypothetical protein M1832_000459 [Thelocarpon impressellum]|nr:MAG: hypothetical protein M1832_000459 [Thelocarpon impressellum]
MSSDSKPPGPASTSKDTLPRKTWDRAEYAAKASAREASERSEGKARHEAKLAGKTYHAPPAASLETSAAEARRARLDVASSVGKVQMLTGAMAGVTGKRGRGAGFWCESCDLTFKDNLQWVEHLNSRQHAVNTGSSGEVGRASVEEVRTRLEALRRKRDEEGTVVVGLGERLEIRREEEEREREARRVKRREARARKRTRGEDQDEDVKVEEGGAEDIGALMGFGGFATTKV